MLKGVNKLLCGVLITASAATVVSSCSSSKEHDEAVQLLELAQANLNQGRYNEASVLLDSLDSSYPTQTDVRKEALALRPKVTELATLDELAQCDSMIEQARINFDAYREKMKRVDHKEWVEGYWIGAQLDPIAFMNSTGVQGRVDDSGNFSIVSEVNGAGNLHHNSITVSVPSGASASSEAVAYDNELNYRINGSETVNYNAEKVDSLARFMVENQGSNFTVTFNGEKGVKKKIQLKSADAQGIINAYQMATHQLEGKRLTAHKALLEKRLELARQQQNRVK